MIGRKREFALPRLRRSEYASSQRGAVLYEFAWTLFFLLTFMFGIMDFGRAVYAYHFVAYAAHEATRWVSLRGSSCKTFASACPATSADVSAFVVGIVPQGVYYNSNATANTAGYLKVTTTWPGTTGNPPGCDTTKGTNSPGCVVKIKVQYTYGFSLLSLRFFSYFNLTSVNMTSTSQLTISQ